jgi:activator of HSP90 ATPase
MSTNSGDAYELFGGNVHGKIISAEPEKKLVQTWQLRNPNWPSEHFATMTITLDQGSDSTSAVFDLSGVPTGQEETIQNAVDMYYVRGFKQMGLGTIL